MIKNLLDKTLLYAEDEKSIRIQYGMYFNNIFKEVYLASDGEEALMLYSKNKPDAIILDIKMPKIDGIALTKQIRNLNQNIPIILMTAMSDRETLKQAIELQLLTYLEKPVSRNDLKGALEKLSKKFIDDNILQLWKIENSNYIWNKKEKSLYCNNLRIKLTKKEILLLSLLIEKKSMLCTYQDIYEYVWQDSDKAYSESTIKTLLSTLKSKLPKDVIKNQYGVGYSI